MAPNRPVALPRDDPGATARGVLEHAASRAPTLGEGRLICVDGPAGSGKTTLAGHLLGLAPTATAVHMDDLYEGWDGLPGVDERLGRLLRPLAEGRPGSYRRWDWHAGRWAETVRVPPADLVVVEGVGSGSLGVADLVTTLVWVDAPHRLRRRRGIDRDGAAFAPHWHAWAEQEQRHHASHHTRSRADLLVDTGEDTRLRG